ncbi:transposase [Streptomyces vietnamensis]|uniref:Transposase n=1 Tax=Streptomyces vietnamensis TaxID=362257 RepID=A0A0B5II73_9ACTN|nr:transposase [Streptomyces vietnamensis]AJF69373.1 transposase [Streptomyces vietnamensis]
MTTPWTAPTRGHTNDCTRFTTMMEAIRVPRPGPGHPRIRPDHVLDDKGYSSNAIRARRGSHRGRPPAFDRAVSKHHHVAERCFNHLKQCRGSAIRFDKLAVRFEATVLIAAIGEWT